MSLFLSKSWNPTALYTVDGRFISLGQSASLNWIEKNFLQQSLCVLQVCRTIYIPSGFAGFCLILPRAMTMMNRGLQGLLVGMILCFISPSHAVIDL